MTPNAINGWREVVAIIFEGFRIEYGVSPTWLINPETGRRLKLDYLFPDIGVAVRFTGQTAPGRRQRKSDEEVEHEAERERARAAVCRANGIVLISVDPDEEPRITLRNLETGLAHASSVLARSTLPHSRKQALIPQLSEARRLTGSFVTKLSSPDRLSLYAERWFDRQDALAAQGPAPRPVTTIRPYRVGMDVSHDRFGPGVITAMKPHDGDMELTVAFADGVVRTLLASLVGELLIPD